MHTIGVFAMIFDEQRRLLCVRMNYSLKLWTTPGGRIEPFESPTQALKREVFEESGYMVDNFRLIGIYAKPFENDLVLSYRAYIQAREDWQPNNEISEVRWFGYDELPGEMSFVVRTRIEDAFADNGVYHREFTSPNILAS